MLLPALALALLGGSSAHAVTGPTCAAGAANVYAELIALPDLVGAGDDEFRSGNSGQELVRRVRTVRAAKGRTVFSVRVDARRQSDAVHRVTARVRFRKATGTRTRTLALTYQRCPRAAAKPLFTG